MCLPFMTPNLLTVPLDVVRAVTWCTGTPTRTHHPFQYFILPVSGQLPEQNILSLKAMVEKKPIPVFTTLADVFGSTEASLPHAERWNTLAVQFESRFGRKPAYIARAPGRVK